MRAKWRSEWLSVVAIFAMAAIIAAPLIALASTKVTYTGQGLMADGFGGYDLNTELCGVENGADAAGPYLLWVFTANGAASATITLPDGTFSMSKEGRGAGVWKYVSAWYEPNALIQFGVFANYEGRARGNVQLTISHGCRPFSKKGAWCSPGFWGHARDGAWTLIGVNKTESFNSTVVPDFYDTTFGANPTLQIVLGNPSTYSGAPSGPLGLNAFNATGAFLTNQIPGYFFDINLLSEDESTTCPIDSFGNFKQ